MIFNSLISSIPSFRLSLNELCAHPWIRNYPVNEQLVQEEMDVIYKTMKEAQQQ